MQEMQAPFLGWEDPLEESMTTCSIILAGRIPWAKEPGGLWSMGCKEAELDTTEVTEHTRLNKVKGSNSMHNYFKLKKTARC